MFKLQNRQQGISFFEMLLVIMIITTMLVFITRQYMVLKEGRVSKRDLALVQQHMAMLRKAAEAFRQSDCWNRSTYRHLTCDDMVSVQGFATKYQCEAALINPWGSHEFEVGLSLEEQKSSAFLVPRIWMSGVFDRYPGGTSKQAIDDLTNLLKPAYIVGTTFIWVFSRMNYYSVTDPGVWYRAPGNYNAVSTATAVGGTPYSPGLWIMNNNLNQWATDQANSIQKQKLANPTLCPN